jgi:hypothetical protein
MFYFDIFQNSTTGYLFVAFKARALTCKDPWPSIKPGNHGLDSKDIELKGNFIKLLHGESIRSRFNLLNFCDKFSQSIKSYKALILGVRAGATAARLNYHRAHKVRDGVIIFPFIKDTINKIVCLVLKLTT